ncbi:MAG: lipoprotein NlpI [Candidatus Methanofastidiosum methylothiophilum]|uniref:Lipoprotein NlpI n=1 Tax=Candidatus Methanofastidiosum methylothiophilum TaxID=1705564 RepID=A0A150J419_9EURY|nr:MAG: lipoprotein NlpI [Candidatus Methanofastidiosum methylthiophilus]
MYLCFYKGEYVVNNSPSTTFLSYSHKNRDIAEEIDNFCLSIGKILTKDDRDIRYKDSISGYMKKIRQSDFAILLISDDFLKSINCMYEVYELIKEEDYKDKILPILIEPINIFTYEGILNYINYWDEKEKECRNKLNEKDPLKTIKLREDHKIIDNIGHEIGDFLEILKGIKCKTYEEIKKSGYIDIINIIAIDDKQIAKEIFNIRNLADNEDKELNLESLLTKYPKNKELMFYKALLYSEKKEYKKSKRYYEDLIDSYPNFPSAYNNLGSLLFDHFNEYDKARACYEKAIELDPYYVNAHNNLGILLFTQFKQPGEAKKYYERAIDLDPKFAKTYTNLGILLYTFYNEYDKARACYERAIELDPNLAFAHNNLGNLLFDHFNEYDKARACYEKAIELYPDYVEANYHLGILLFTHFNESDEAKKYYEKTLELNPNYPPALYSLGYLLLSSNRYKKYNKRAKELIEKAIRLDPTLTNKQGIYIINGKNYF